MGMFDNFQQNAGNAAKGMIAPMGNLATSLAPAIGTIAGGKAGGQQGANIGNAIGGGLGYTISQLNGHQMPNMGLGHGPAVTDALNAFIPQGYHNQNFGQIGGQLLGQGGNMLGDYFGQNGIPPELGQALAAMGGIGAGALLNHYAPGALNQTPGGLTQAAGNYVGNMANSYAAPQLSTPAQRQQAAGTSNQIFSNLGSSMSNPRAQQANTARQNAHQQMLLGPGVQPSFMDMISGM